jgi:protein-tyrosine phosphatase
MEQDLSQITDASGYAPGDAPGPLDPRDVDDLVFADGRRLELDGLFNLRDAGGYPTAGGRKVRWRTLLRSDALHRLDAAGSAVLAGFGLRTILDLRTTMEAEIAPSALDGLPASARLTHISLLTGDLQALPLELDAIYGHMIDQCGDTIAAAIRVLSTADAYPALVHCSAGKDRTGIVVALILAVLGVPDELIAADYGLSASYLDAERTPAIGQLQASTGLGDALTKPLLSSPPTLMLDVLARARTAGGSVDTYLLGHGLTAADLGRLRAALLV